MIQIAALLLDLSGTLILLQPPADPAALAEVYFENAAVNDERHNGTYTISGEGLTVDIEFMWNAAHGGMDRIRVIPPTGVECVPMDCTSTVLEGFKGVVVLYDWRGM